MDNIPIFDGKDASITCGQFLALIDEKADSESLSEDELKEFCHSNMSGDAQQFFASKIDMPWEELKIQMVKEFSMKLSIKEKVELRKSLKQLETEAVEDFYKRCQRTQFLVSDDIRDVAFEREVLLNFLIGLHSAIQKAVLTANCKNADGFISEAKKHFILPKLETLVPEVKLESQHWDDYSDPNENHEKDDSIMYDYEEDKYDPVPSYEDQEEDYFVDDQEDPMLQPQEVVKSKQGSRDLKCPLCEKTFRTLKGRTRHLEESHKDAQKSCDICGEVFPESQALARHIVLQHCTMNDKKQYVCLYCSVYQRMRMRDVRNHIMAIHWEMKNVYFNCKQCEKVFEKSTSLKDHIKTAHNNEKPYQCDKCPKTFRVQWSLKSHIMVHHESKKDLQCDQCEKIFTNEIHLKQHMNLKHRSDPKPEPLSFICEDCGHVTATKANLQRHCLVRHASNEEKERVKVTCEHPGCEFSALTKEQVIRHNKRVHLKIRNHKCPHCGQMFGSKDRMTQHINGIHLGLKPLTCDICSTFATAYNSTLSEHKRIVHGNQRFACSLCSHVAKYKNNLQKHVNTVHKSLKA